MIPHLAVRWLRSLAFLPRGYVISILVLSLMALLAGGKVIITEDPSSAVHSVVVTTKTASSAPFSARTMACHLDFAWHGQRLIVAPFNRVAFVAFPTSISYVRLMSKRRSVGFAR